MTTGIATSVVASKLPNVLGISAAMALSLLATYAQPTDRLPHTILANLSCANGYRIVEPRTSSPEYAVFRSHNANRASSLPSLLQTKIAEIAQPARPGVAQLLLGNWSKAIAILDGSSSPDARIDLAAAYYMRGLTSGSLLDFCRALNVLRDAGDTPEALFNRALILEQLSDNEGATHEWSRYLARDATSPWAAEALLHLRRARQPSAAAAWVHNKSALLRAACEGDTATVRKLYARHRLATSQMVERELFVAWGRSLLAHNDAAAKESLSAARVIVEQRPIRDDLLLHDAVAEIEHTRNPITLARAYAAFGDGMRAFNLSQYDAAVESFERGLQIGQQASAFRAIVFAPLVTADYRRYQNEKLKKLIPPIRARYSASHYPSLIARLDWTAGLVAIAEPDAPQSLVFYERALAEYDRLDEPEFRGAQHINQIETYLYLGDSDRAAVHLRAALPLVSMAEDQGRLQGLLKMASRFCLVNGAPEAAVVFQNRLVNAARGSHDPMRLPDALVSRSSYLIRAGRRAKALRDINDARKLAVKIEDDTTRLRLQADASVAEALAERNHDDKRVVENLSCAFDIYRALTMNALNAQLCLERGRAYLRLGAADAAERNFRQGIAIVEEQRGRVVDPTLRVSYFDRAEQTFSDLAGLLLSRGNVEEAFDLLERFRSRELLDRTAKRPPITAAAIRKILPDDTMLITHTAHAQGLMTFVVTRDSVRGFNVPISQRELGELVDTIGAAFDAHNPLPPNALRRLGEILIDPIGDLSASRIVFVPDEILTRVPFAALRLANGRYLVESHTSSEAPSATLLAWALQSRRVEKRSRSILIVASREQPVGTDLPPLVRTFAEARSVARRYSRSTILSHDKSATILRAARDYDLLHFAAHSIVDVKKPSNSALLLGATERMTADEIQATDLSNLELVVLGGCNSGLGKNYRSEGPMSLARAFMGASVPATLSTIAPVTDENAERVLREFHRAYARHFDAARALREAQLLMLRSANQKMREPGRWSAFHVVGITPDRR